MTNFFQKIKKTKTKQEDQDFVSKNIEEKKPENNWFEAEGQLVLDVFRKGDELIIRAPIAGVKKEDIDVTIDKDFILIKGERKKPGNEEENFFYKECYWGKFSREIVAPVEVDGNRAKASMDQGILTIALPIIEREEKKKLKIKE